MYFFLFYKDTIIKWKAETNCDYPIVSDTKRSLYQAFHLGSSLKYTWDIKTQMWYATQICLDRTLYPMLENDDPHQLGGDVVVVGCGGDEAKLTMIHRSTTPIDRPTIPDILKHISQRN